MFIETAPGVQLFVQVQGEGEAVVLLHGHSLDHTVFDPLAEPLAAAGYRVVRYDQRGHGRSSSPPQGYRFGDHVADLAALLAALGVGWAHLVGLSKGGGIALEAALRRPELVRSLVLLGPLVPDYPLPEEFVGFFRTLARAIRQQGVEPAVRQLWLPHPLFASALRDPRTRQKLEAMVLRFPAGEYLATARDEPDRSWSVAERLGEIACPTLVVAGEADIPEFRAMAQFAAQRIPGACLALISACGHLLPLEAPEPLLELLLPFLASQRPPERFTGTSGPSRGGSP